jgi:hypothetical protein
MLKLFVEDPGFGAFLTMDLESGVEKFESGINISDPG